MVHIINLTQAQDLKPDMEDGLAGRHPILIPNSGVIMDNYIFRREKSCDIWEKYTYKEIVRLFCHDSILEFFAASVSLGEKQS